jgi:NMD protein affecting ribosome stability and mRNA decay
VAEPEPTRHDGRIGRDEGVCNRCGTPVKSRYDNLCPSCEKQVERDAEEEFRRNRP